MGLCEEELVGRTESLCAKYKLPYLIPSDQVSLIAVVLFKGCVCALGEGRGSTRHQIVIGRVLRQHRQLSVEHRANYGHVAVQQDLDQRRQYDGPG